MKGWIYIVSNEAIPGLVKIGYSLKDPIIRAKEFDSTGLPYPYKVEYELLIENPAKFEKEIHRYLVNKHEKKEWFRCSVDEAMNTIRIIAKEYIIYENLNNELSGECPQCSGRLIYKNIANIKVLKCISCNQTFRKK